MLLGGLLGEGVAVTVERLPEGATDAHGNPAPGEWAPEEVVGVLPQPGGTSDLDASRPEGVSVDMTFHFPKGYTASLKGCRIAYGGRTYRVIGDPQPHVADLTPGPWNRAVQTEAVDG